MIKNHRNATFGVATLLLATAEASGAFAQSAHIEQSLNRLTGFARANPACVEMTDGCHVCVRPGADDPQCSTPGIACQPAAWQCNKERGRTSDSETTAKPQN